MISTEERRARLKAFRAQPCALFWNPLTDEPSVAAQELFYKLTVAEAFKFICYSLITTARNEQDGIKVLNALKRKDPCPLRLKEAYLRKAICFELAHLCRYTTWVSHVVLPFFQLRDTKPPSKAYGAITFEQLIAAEREICY